MLGNHNDYYGTIEVGYKIGKYSAKHPQQKLWNYKVGYSELKKLGTLRRILKIK